MKKFEWLDCQGNEFFPKQKGTPSLVKIEHKNTATLDSARSKKNLVAVLQLHIMKVLKWECTASPNLIVSYTCTMRMKNIRLGTCRTKQTSLLKQKHNIGLGAEFARGRVCQGPSLLGAEMSRNRVTQPGSIPIILGRGFGIMKR